MHSSTKRCFIATSSTRMTPDAGRRIYQTKVSPDTFVQWIRLRALWCHTARTNRMEVTMASANGDFLDFSGKAVLITDRR